MSTASVGPVTPGPMLHVSLPAGSDLVRIHRLGKGAVWFGPAPGQPPAYRFDAPAGQYRTMYAAEHIDVAFAETVLRLARRIVSRTDVEHRQWSVLRAGRDLKLLKLFDNGLIAHGVTADICTGNDYRTSQALALRFHATHPDLDGIAYRSRHDNGRLCYAVFDRLTPAELTSVNNHRFIDEKAMADGLLRHYGASWDPCTPLPPP